MPVLTYIDYTLDTREIKRESIALAVTAHELAEKLGEESWAIVVNCKNVAVKVQEMKIFRKVLYVKIEELGEGQYSPIAFSYAIAETCKKYDVHTLLFPATWRCREIAPHVAALLQTGIVADVSKLYVDEQREVVSVKPSFGENILAHITIPGRKPKVFTVRTSLEQPNFQYNKCELVQETVKLRRGELLENIKLRRIVKVEDPESDILPDKADIVLGVGAGVRSENIQLVKEIARKLKLGIAATKKVTDRGILSSKFLVGESGRVIRPRIYIALGISGAPQHLSGVKDCKILIAVNINENAPIARQCDYFIRADANEIIRQLAQRVITGQ